MVGILEGQRNSRKQGDVGLGVAIGHFVEKGFTVSIPLTDSQDYDLIVDIDGRLRKVQVKTSYSKQKSGSYSVELRTKGGNKSGTGKVKKIGENVDLVFIFVESGNKYLVPASVLANKTSICVGLTNYNEYAL